MVKRLYEVCDHGKEEICFASTVYKVLKKIGHRNEKYIKNSEIDEIWKKSVERYILDDNEFLTEITYIDYDDDYDETLGLDEEKCIVVREMRYSTLRRVLKKIDKSVYKDSLYALLSIITVNTRLIEELFGKNDYKLVKEKSPKKREKYLYLVERKTYAETQFGKRCEKSLVWARDMNDLESKVVSMESAHGDVLTITNEIDDSSMEITGFYNEYFSRLNDGENRIVFNCTRVDDENLYNLLKDVQENQKFKEELYEIMCYINPAMDRRNLFND